MKAQFNKNITLLPSQMDALGGLGMPNAFELFMDTGAQTAAVIGAGWDRLILEKGVFWITVRTMLRFARRPAAFEEVQVSAVMDAPGPRRCRTHYAVSQDGRTLVRAQTEWALMNPRTGEQFAPADILSPDIEWQSAPDDALAFPRIDADFPDPPFAEHRVVSTEIDLAGHMNNVAYMRAVQNAFSVAQWREMRVKEAAFVFLSSAKEGDRLLLQSRTGDGHTDIRAAFPDGRTALLARLGHSRV